MDIFYCDAIWAHECPAAFIDLMHRVFHSYLDRYVVIFIYNILVYSESEEDYEEHLRTILRTLKEHQLYTKFSKGEFWLNRVTFLGHIISQNGLEVDPNKVEVIVN